MKIQMPVRYIQLQLYLAIDFKLRILATALSHDTQCGARVGRRLIYTSLRFHIFYICIFLAICEVYLKGITAIDACIVTIRKSSYSVPGRENFVGNW